MTVSRRSFFASLAAVVVALAVPVPARPVMYRVRPTLMLDQLSIYTNALITEMQAARGTKGIA